MLSLFPAYAGTSGTLFLRAHVPSRFKVVVDSQRGSFSIQNNLGKFALSTHVIESLDTRGFRVITVIPQ